jgi:site-specific DNA-methyltransferase (adenine-specific)
MKTIGEAPLKAQQGGMAGCATPEGDLHLYHADCLEGLNCLAPNSVHLCLTDPPYFLDGMGDEWSADRLKDGKEKAGVVGGMRVGMKFDRMQGIRLQQFCLRLAEKLMLVLVPGAFLIAFAQPRLYHRMSVAFEDAGFEIRDQVIWVHEGGQGKAFTMNHFVRRMPIPQEEKDALIASMEDRKTPQLRPMFESILVAQKPKEGTHVDNWIKWGTGLVQINFKKGQQSPVFRFNKPKEGVDHPSVKPTDLMERLIEVFSKRGQTVLDPFTGSGTTGIACARKGRKFVGFEIDRGYFDLAAMRIAEARQNLGKSCPVPSADVLRTCPAGLVILSQGPTGCAGPGNFTGCTGPQGPVGYAECTVPLAENLDGLHG